MRKSSKVFAAAAAAALVVAGGSAFTAANTESRRTRWRATGPAITTGVAMLTMEVAKDAANPAHLGTVTYTVDGDRLCMDFVLSTQGPMSL